MKREKRPTISSQFERNKEINYEISVEWQPMSQMWQHTFEYFFDIYTLFPYYLYQKCPFIHGKMANRGCNMCQCKCFITFLGVVMATMKSIVKYRVAYPPIDWQSILRNVDPIPKFTCFDRIWMSQNCTKDYSENITAHWVFNVICFSKNFLERSISLNVLFQFEWSTSMQYNAHHSRYHLKDTHTKTTTIFHRSLFTVCNTKDFACYLMSKKLRILIFHVRIEVGQCFDVDCVFLFRFVSVMKNAE